MFNRHSCEGFTLGEVMVSLLLVVLAILSATLFFGTISRAADFTEKVTTGSELAQAKIEELIEGTYPSMASGEDTVPPYRRVWSVTNTSGMAEITVRAEWQDIGGHRRSVVLRTLRSQ